MVDAVCGGNKLSGSVKLRYFRTLYRIRKTS